MKKGLHKFKKVCYDNPRWETSIAIWACSSVGRAYGSHPYAVTSHGFGSLPIQQSDFPDIPFKIEYSKNPFFITFLMKNG